VLLFPARYCSGLCSGLLFSTNCCFFNELLSCGVCSDDGFRQQRGRPAAAAHA
jgi:hypothetical protein